MQNEFSNLSFVLCPAWFVLITITLEAIMARVIFYQKLGCINNDEQKALLLAAGHKVEAHNLLKTPWSAAKLRLFFDN